MVKINVDQRAKDIADRDAKILYYKTHDFKKYVECWIETYLAVLREHQPYVY